jgi:hypothetical protein
MGEKHAYDLLGTIPFGQGSGIRRGQQKIKAKTSQQLCVVFSVEFDLNIRYEGVDFYGEEKNKDLDLKRKCRRNGEHATG